MKHIQFVKDDCRKQTILRKLLPLPRHIAVESEVILSAGEIGICNHGLRTSQVDYAVKMLGELPLMQALASVWQKILPEYEMKARVKVESKDRALNADERLK